MTYSPAEKYDLLCARLRNLGSVLVAYSGGVDSTLLAVASHAVLGDDTLAVLAHSDVNRLAEIEAARGTAAQLGLRLHEVDTHELTDPRFCDNPPDRCYYCKSELFGMLRAVADVRGLRYIADGSNSDDLSDHRPGRRAAQEMGVVHPLQDAGMCKGDIREVSRMLGLPTWDQPSTVCLASRFPYGHEITEEGIARVLDAEDALRALGIREFRVRVHGEVARLEVEPADMERVFEMRDRVVEALKGAGFAYVAQDLEGYRQGSLNETLPNAAREGI